MSPEIKKYLQRFILLIAVALPILYFSQGSNTLKIIGYKSALAIIGLTLADLHWSLSHKPFYGKTEVMSSYEKLSVLVFRGLIGGAIVLGFMLGL